MNPRLPRLTRAGEWLTVVILALALGGLLLLAGVGRDAVFLMVAVVTLIAYRLIHWALYERQ